MLIPLRNGNFKKGEISTCALFCGPPFALSIHVAAKGSGEMLIHHAADVSLVIGEEDTARRQILCLGGLLFLLGTLLWPHGRVGRRWSAGGRRWGSWSSGARDPRHPLGTPGSVHKIPAVSRSSAHTCGSLTAGDREFHKVFCTVDFGRGCGQNNNATHATYLAEHIQFTNPINVENTAMRFQFYAQTITIRLLSLDKDRSPPR